MAATPTSSAPEGAATISSTLASRSAEERATAYDWIDGAVKDRDVALCAPCVRPVITEVLCAPASRVGVAEYIRAALLLYEMAKIDMVVICGEAHRKDERGVPLCIQILTAPDTVFAEVLAKEPRTFTKGDAVVAAAGFAYQVVCWAVGITPVLAYAKVDEAEWFAVLLAGSPYHGEHPAPSGVPVRELCADPPDRFTPLALLLCELLRSEMDTQPEGVIVGAAGVINWMCLHPPQGSRAPQALWEADFLGIFQSTMQRYNAMERISRHVQIPGAVLGCVKDIVEGAEHAGVEVTQSLLDAGAVDIAISSLQAYQILNRPEECSVNSLQWGGLWFLEVLLASPQASQTIITKLRSAGVDAFRFMLDHPLIMMGDLAYETGSQATRIAAIVWGKDDDAGGLRFKQQDIDKIVQVADHRNPATAAINPMTDYSGKVMLQLCISDTNKELLLRAQRFVPVLVDSLLLDEAHPRRAQPNFEAIAAPVQRDAAEAIAHLSMYPPGREALLQDPSVTTALQQVAVEGWAPEAQVHAQSALAALENRKRDAPHERCQDPNALHVMMSYQWNVQACVKRVVAELQQRGYRMWFDLQDMKGAFCFSCICLLSMASSVCIFVGSTVDAMSEAVDNAAVMLSCISLAYKESASKLLEKWSRADHPNVPHNPLPCLQTAG